MRQVQRHDIELGENVLEIPRDSEILCVKNVREVLRVWFVSGSDGLSPPRTCTIVVVHDGADVPDGAKYLDTCVTLAGEVHAWLMP